ncbi:3-phosphoserine/phosphohydroxythreonine transaminase [Paenibacillus filicis]|uniref:Phosphoserine aminotransferase n=1 Tax=Paenibacillus gyeongsangnamensis TaxID=3388067 RepID=A0ABT4Q9H7_9BACL|nr:3-phosphoserine/phosphohydroxythreonine transaminase [Paenibacillus filicis]MCZ8513412.1 3-phosphoserine/phosphohydroxythreonine transaminase [Paenibacillus filicis]
MDYRAHNFFPGPAALPLEVLEQAREELVGYRGHGMSLMEMSHRTEAYERLNEETQELLLSILGLPKGYRALFMGGGASTQFALVPLNLLGPGRKGWYAITGQFAEKAYEEARTVGDAAVVASSKAMGWSVVPSAEELKVPESESGQVAYLHITVNNTIEGSRYPVLPEVGEVPLIGDVTSEVLSRTMDYSRFGLFYAGAQKNLGPAGVTVVVLREELLKQASTSIPTIFRYETYVKHRSLYNTPPVHSVYMLRLVLEWVQRQGGVAALERRNVEKARLLYDVMDASRGFYRGVVAQPYRSVMNITWRMADEALERMFVEASEREGFAGLAGHRSVGGLRASAYNAVPVEACRALAEFMTEFQRRHG